MHISKQTILSFILGLSLTVDAQAQDLTWGTYPPTALSHNFGTVGDAPVDVTALWSGDTDMHSNVPAAIASPRPRTINGETHLRVRANFNDLTKCMTLTMQFSAPVTNLSFNLYYINYHQYSSDPVSNSILIRDKVTVLGSNGGTPVTPSITAVPGINTVTGSTITGIAEGDSSNTVTFTQPVTEFSIQYCIQDGVVVPIAANGDVFDIGPLTWDAAALPVRLSSFQGQALDNHIQLGWTTSWEQHSSHFEIQRSANAVSFEKVGQVASLGTMADRQTAYGFSDPSPVLGWNYYRLRQMDTDGGSAYSKIISINYREGSSYFSVSPAGEGTVEVLTNAVNPQFEVVNLTGQNLLHRVETMGENRYRLRTIGGRPSFGVVRMQADQTIASKKVLLSF